MDWLTLTLTLKERGTPSLVINTNQVEQPARGHPKTQAAGWGGQSSE